ncbi:hypothetical protein BCV69DRAFT_293564 [Microstroma glucosiphilum]|uniref:Uncharacterized protein n=1 Tax=Pseudomicrostroma glucosiphilum TaxID=1684307 RepID=A0A316U6N2_9BASI|nr:hypothetical protein BCV69DRAFT_293564 [Pseudomicrostroma glucosiphilum]PWN20927.1 hypothetical protein BCV69DRAFT_293564 [Pseudomicrostroma glucosiphilum]
MVLARLPSFLRQRDHWSPCSNSSPPAASLSPAQAYSSPTMVSSPSGLKAGFEFGLSSPTFSWGSIFGLSGGNDLTTFDGLTVEDHVGSPASSSGGSAAQLMPFSDMSVKLPAWCTDEVADHSSPEAEEVAPSSALTPSKKLRRTGRLGKMGKAGKGPRFESSSPDIDEGSDFAATRSFYVDPYLHPTPANRPLRQYVSAPELSEHQQQQIMAAAAASAQTPTPSGLASSSSMDDLFMELGWPSARQEQHMSPLLPVGGAASVGGLRQHGSASQAQQPRQHAPRYQSYQESRPSSSSSAGQLSLSGGDVENRGLQSQQLQSSGSGLGEIDGSLYLRRRRHSKDTTDMPNPAPIDTSNGPLSGSLLQKRSLHALDAHSAPLLGASQREQQRLNLQQLQLQSSALQNGNSERLSNLFSDFLQENDGTRQGGAGTGLGALELDLGSNFGVENAQTDQSSYGQHYLLYSDTTLQSASAANNLQAPFGYTSNYPPSSAAGSSSPAQPRRNTLTRSRKSSTVVKGSPLQPGKHESRTMSAGQVLWPGQGASTSSSSASSLLLPPTATQNNAYATPRSTQPGNEVSMPKVPVFVPAFADPWNAQGNATPSTASSGSVPPSSTSSGGQGEGYALHRPLLPYSAQSMPNASPKQARKMSSAPNMLRPAIASAPLPGATTFENITPDSPRKIAGTRRVQSSKDLRDKAKRSPDAAAPPLPAPAGGSFSFVNYGIEDAQELCSAVAPSGSYKIPLKGYGGPSADGAGTTSSSSSSQQLPATPPRTSSALATLGHKAPSAALKNKIRPRVKVDNSRWIQETGEDSEGDSDSDDGFDEEEERRGGKRHKGEAGALSSAGRARKRVGV